MFKLQSLFHVKDGDKISGAMSPVLFAQEMTKQLGIKIAGLVRVIFNEDKIHQNFEDGGLTGHDTLILVTRTPEYNQHIMFVDEGVGGVPVALWLSNEPVTQLQVTPIYLERKYAAKCDSELMGKVFTAADELLIKQVFPLMDAQLNPTPKPLKGS